METPDFKKISKAETKYEGGAQRDSRIGKGPCSGYRSSLALVSCIYQMGNIQRDRLAGGPGNGDSRNWENGMKIGDLLDSSLRHIGRYLEGDRSEPHLPQACWNAFNALQMSVWVATGYRSAAFNNLPDHTTPGWKPGDPPPFPLSQQEVGWLKVRGIYVKEASLMTPAYLAAMVDAEGTITITRRELSRKEAYALKVTIYSTNQALLWTIRSHFGGHVTRARHATDQHAEAWTLYWDHAAAGEVVRIIQPMLIVKTGQAAIALEFQDIVSAINPGRAGIPKETLDRLRSLKDKINRLNLKGPKKRTVGEGG